MVDRAEQDFNGGADFVRPGQYAEAVASYDTSIAIKPDYIEEWYDRGIALKILNRQEEAVAAS